MYRSKSHLDFSDRVAIETGLLQGLSFKEIARKIGRHASTIAHEVKVNRTFIGGIFSYGKDCMLAHACKEKHLCALEYCTRKCRTCLNKDCRSLCGRYQKSGCSKIFKPPYVCNRCSARRACTRNRYQYSAKFAEAAYRRRLSDARRGIRLDREELKKLDQLVTRLVKKGQPLSHIHSEHQAELNISLRSMYNYIDSGVLTVRNIDLRRKTGYRPRRKDAQLKLGFQNQDHRKGRTYDDYLEFLEKNPDTPVVEMDTVKGVRESGKRLLTMIFCEKSIMLLFLMPDGKAESVIRVFDYLTEILGLETFRRLFPLILTDNGSEFKRVEDLENASLGEVRTKIFYCDPQASWQKPHIEKNHEYIRYVIPRGKSLNPYTESDITLLMDHINSVRRKGLRHQSPYETVREEDELFKVLMQRMEMHIIPPDDVHLKPDLLRR